jgi:hypothetical protein
MALEYTYVAFMEETTGAKLMTQVKAAEANQALIHLACQWADLPETRTSLEAAKSYLKKAVTVYVYCVETGNVVFKHG